MDKLLADIASYVEEKKLNLYDVAVCDRERTEKVVFSKANPCQNSYSVAKLFCVTAIGMLYDDGLVTPDMTVGEIFKEEIASYGIDENKWKNITVDHVLTHKIGFEHGFLDIDTENAAEYESDDFLYLVLSHDIPLEPGSKYVYSDAAYYLASRIVTKLSGIKLDALLWDRMFKFMKIRETAFSRCPHGYPVGATGLYIRTTDMLKLGRVYLDGGIYAGERIISEEWIKIVLERGYELKKYASGYSKGGMRGQRLYINPETGVAVAWHAFEQSDRVHEMGKALL